MKIIRDQTGLGFYMIPLFVDWKVRRCNIEHCLTKPTTIITGLHEDLPIVGVCEEHYQELNQPNGATFIWVLDDYDAFKEVDRISAAQLTQDLEKMKEAENTINERSR